MSEWRKTTCILCESNCGVEIRLDGRRFERVRGDKEHVGSKGYTCEKALRLDHYQNGRHRLTSPMRRRDDGTYEEVDWHTAIREVADGLLNVRDTHGGESILYYGGGGQGNHLGGAYSTATRSILGSRFRSSALAQEKTGEFWVNVEIGRAHYRGDFEHTEVAVFIGKNPWQSHGFPEARRVLKEISRDEKRSMVVIDPRRTETADLADYFLQVKPGTDAYCLAALVAILFDEQLIDRTWVREHVVGTDEVEELFRDIAIAEFAERCGVPEDLLRATARRIGTASSVAIFEDLGVQMAPHSTVNSWIEKLIWIMTGNFAKPGGMNVPVPLVPIARSTPSKGMSPVTGSRVISGMIPCNVIAEEVLADDPNAFKAMFIESANPAHSLADSPRFREAMGALEFSVVIDVAMTETARHADYVLPASSQYEKWESVFFNFEFPDNIFNLRAPILEPLDGTLTEPEIHYRLCEAMGGLDLELIESLRGAAERDRMEFAMEFYAAISSDPAMGRLAPVVLYATLGQTLPEGAAAAAALWGACQQLVLQNPEVVKAAGFEGEGPALADALFDAMLETRTGVVFARRPQEDSWKSINTTTGKLHAFIPELVDSVKELMEPPTVYTSEEFPMVLAAGERRSFTANTIFRDPGWRKKDPDGALRVSVDDAAALAIETGDKVRVETERGSVDAFVEVTDTLQSGHVTLPNGLGVDYPADDGEPALVGASTNELTSDHHRDDFAGTPFHKHVPARVTKLQASAEGLRSAAG